VSQVLDTCDRLPAAYALRHPGTPDVRYADLGRVIRNVAAQVNALRVRRGHPLLIGLSAEVGPEAVMLMLGVLAAKQAFVFLDLNQPPAVLEGQFARCRPDLLLTVSRQTPQQSGWPPEVQVTLDSASPSSLPEASSLQAHPLMYVCLTSGTTGRPKAVPVPERMLADVIAWQLTESASGAGHVTAQLSALTFDIAYQEVFSTLISGGVLLIAPAALRRDFAALARMIVTKQVERIFVTSAVLHALAAASEPPAGGDGRGTRPGEEHTLREVYTAGDRLHLTGPLKRWLSAGPTRLTDQYGTTETFLVTSRRVDLTDEHPGLLGEPLGEARLLLRPLGQTLRPGDTLAAVPDGETGELLISGPLTPGYLNDEQTTRERFTEVTLNGTPVRVYRTGDLARREHGHLHLLGREGSLIKVAGELTDPGVSERLLATHPDVAQVAVFGQQGETGDHHLLAAVRPRTGLGLDARATLSARLKEALRLTLPDRAVPGAWLITDDLPLTVNGKIDLPAVRLLLGRRHQARLGPDLHGAERHVASVFAELLPGDQHLTITADTDFMEAGGTSLSAARLIARAERDTGVRCSFVSLLSHGRVRDLATWWTGGPTRTSPPPAAGPAAGTVETAPFSAIQREQWRTRLYQGTGQREPEQQAVHPAAHQIDLSFQVHGPLSRQALQEALNTLQVRHPLLGCRVGSQDGQPVLVSGATNPVLIPLALLPGEDAPQGRGPALARLVRDALDRPLDLSRTLWQAYAFEDEGAADGQALAGFSLVFDHLCVDAESLAAAAEELRRVLGGASLGLEEDDYFAQAAAQDHLGAQRRDDLGRYWRHRLGGDLPSSRQVLAPPAPGEERSALYEHPLVVRGDALHALRTCAARLRVSPATLVLSAYARVLALRTYQEDLLIGTTLSLRRQQETSGEHAGPVAFGPLIQEHLLLLQDVLSSSDAALNTQVQARVAEALDHAALPLAELPDMNVVLPPDAHALQFNWQTLPQVQDDPWHRSGPSAGFVTAASATRLTRLPMTQVRPRADLSLYAEDHPHSLELRLQFSAQQWRPGAAEQFARTFAALMARLPVTEAQDRAHEHLGTRPGPLRPVRPYLPLGHRWPRLLAAHADATATETWDEHGTHLLTYRDLGVRVDRARQALADLPAGSRVALVLPRGVAMLTAQLACLLSGLPFVAVDTGMPDERRAWILEDSRPARCVTVDWDGWADPPHQDRPVAAPLLECWPQETPAYVCYTSGTTGRPKGVVSTHGGVLNTLAGLISTVLTRPLRALALSSPSFDASVTETYGPLFSGGTLLFDDQGALGDLRAGAALETLIRDRTVETMSVTPTLFMTLRPEAVPSLTAPIICGEAFPPGLTERWAGRTLWNAYGPTEASICTSVFRADRPLRTVPIGEALPGVTTWVSSETHLERPPGSAGELLIGGAGVSLGYLGLPDRTAERFVLLDTQSGPVRVYRSGDLVRTDEDGQTEYLGRQDQQVKVRGHRLELAGLDHLLGTLPGLDGAGSFLLGDDPLTRELCVALVPAHHAPAHRKPGEADQADHGALRTAAADLLALHLVRALWPSRYYLLPALPLNSSGKFDRSALSAAARAGTLQELQDAPEDLSPATSDTERRVLQLYVTHLPGRTVGRSSTLRGLGANSLQVALIYQALQQDLPDLSWRETERLTVAELSGRIDTHRTGAAVTGSEDDLGIRQTTGSQDHQGHQGDQAYGDRQRALATRRARELSDLRSAAGLPPAQATGPHHPAPLLLTGAAGFLGLRLASDLLARGVPLLLPVRAGSDRQAAERVVRRAQSAGLPLIGAGFQVIAADVGAPHLGLEPARFAALTAHLCGVAHLAAETHFVASYADLERSNVLSTATLLDLCLERHLPMLLVSSLAVGERREQAPQEQPPAGVTGGYPLTKFVAERLMQRASDLGQQTLTVRLPWVSADQDAEHRPGQDFTSMLLADAGQRGLWPQDAPPIPWMTVDRAARALTGLLETLLSGPGLSGTIHLYDQPSLGPELLQVMARRHPGFRQVPVADWLEDLASRKDSPLTPLLPLMRAHWLPAGPAGPQTATDPAGPERHRSMKRGWTPSPLPGEQMTRYWERTLDDLLLQDAPRERAEQP